ncbi:hypothetical protein IKF92_03140, partial [Candidatus Saccharibacteria bacterium]|nr:hypothetical protein [Candidatus Saccharibacteria bacterium]
MLIISKKKLILRGIVSFLTLALISIPIINKITETLSASAASYTYTRGSGENLTIDGGFDGDGTYSVEGVFGSDYPNTTLEESCYEVANNNHIISVTVHSACMDTLPLTTHQIVINLKHTYSGGWEYANKVHSLSIIDPSEPDYTWQKGSTTGLTINNAYDQSTEEPEGIKLNDTIINWNNCITNSDGNITIAASCLNNFEAGTYTINLDYTDEEAPDHIFRRELGTLAIENSSTETYTYKLEFYCSIGSGNPCGTSLTYTGTETSHTFTIPSVVPTDSTRTFDYWATTNISPIPSSAQYPAGSTITLTSAGTTQNLYAIWKTGSTDPDEPYDIGTLNWTKGGSGVLSVDFSRVDGFASTGVSSVQIGTTTLQSGDYVYSSSSQHITMYSSALNQFNAGQYNITIEFTDGFVATGTLNVESATITHTITLNNNGGTGGSSSTTVNEGATTLGTITVPTKANTTDTRTISGF